MKLKVAVLAVTLFAVMVIRFMFGPGLPCTRVPGGCKNKVPGVIQSLQ